MRISDEEFQRLYSGLSPEAQRDARRQLHEWDAPQPAPEPLRHYHPVTKRNPPKRKKRSLWPLIIISYLILIAACVLPALLKIH